MLHLLWYIIVGLVAGFVAKSVMHMHMTLLWTIVLGLVGSILGGFITHLFDRPKPERIIILPELLFPYSSPCWCCGS
jgi:uncharacterized membrane protein YeaQ/YmgE (transglycosylase-associated protein family)